ncbi:hypothetical protein [Winogradskyella sp. R77965]|uniref:hypothetical protein n=1 Tax=Winogradskyella sp. R77965 TaxID=3093872 RepID=UPI0037DC2A86
MKKDKLYNIKSTGFKTPDNYFESFDDKLFERLPQKDSVDSVKTTGYKTPKDYFDTVEANVFSKLSDDEKPVIKLSTRKTFYYVAGVAASLLLLFAVFINSDTTEELSVEMVENYLGNEDLNSYELAELLSDSDLLEDDFIITKTTYQEDNLESYLLENSDIESILE